MPLSPCSLDFFLYILLGYYGIEILFFFKVHLFTLREQERASWGGAERGIERESQAGSTLPVQSPMWVLKSQIVRSWPEPKSRVRCLIDWATQARMKFLENTSLFFHPCFSGENIYEIYYLNTLKYTYVSLSTFSLFSNHHLCSSPERPHRLKLDFRLLEILNLNCPPAQPCRPPSYLLFLKLITLGISYMWNCILLILLCWHFSVSIMFVRFIWVIACVRIPFM